MLLHALMGFAQSAKPKKKRNQAITETYDIPWLLDGKYRVSNFIPTPYDPERDFYLWWYDFPGRYVSGLPAVGKIGDSDLVEMVPYAHQQGAPHPGDASSLPNMIETTPRQVYGNSRLTSGQEGYSFQNQVYF